MLPERIADKIIPEPNSGCWLWMGALDTKGYGKTKYEGRNWLVHRLIFCIKNKLKITDGKFVCHKCDNTLCVNPNHMFIGTQKDNMLDASRKGRLKGKRPRMFNDDGMLVVINY
jgi:HNH endonuclease